MRIIIIRPVTDAPPPDATPPDARASAADSDTRPARVDSASLLGHAREMIILHAGREYRLRVTQHGKLILTA